MSGVKFVVISAETYAVGAPIQFKPNDKILISPDYVINDSSVSGNNYTTYSSAYINSIISSRGIPAGGTTGQVLAKINNSDY